MGSEWYETLLGQVAEDLTVGHVGSMAAEYVPTGIPFLRSQNIEPFRLDFTDVKYISHEFHSRLKKSALLPGDVVIVRTGNPGTAAVIPDAVGELNCSDLVIVRPGSNLDSKFLCYYINGIAQQHVDAHLAGAVQQHFNVGSARQLPLKLPPLPEQRAIASVLGALEDKIELNRQMNRTLEEMAAALFKSWFVDFDPVHAKAEGRRPFGMDDETAALFPDRFVETGEGLVPEGWETTTLKEQTTKIGSGATPRGGKAAYVDDGIALIRSQNVYDSEFVWRGLARITDDAAEKLAGVTVERNDVLLNITGASILRTCVIDPSVLPARVNQHVAIVRAKEGVPARYIHAHLLNQSTKNYLMGMDAGGSREAVTKGHIESVPMLLPSRQILSRFENLVQPMFEAIENDLVESRTLADLRDTLLPKLLSGEIRLKQAEKAVEKIF